jgi:hypothetical protein
MHRRLDFVPLTAVRIRVAVCRAHVDVRVARKKNTGRGGLVSTVKKMRTGKKEE